MSTLETYRDFYEYEADVYRITPEAESAWTHRRNLVHRLLPKGLLGPVLDAGCGDGALADDLKRLVGGEVVGLDLARKRVAFAQSRTRGVHFGQASIYDLPFLDDRFELVVCTDLLEHLDEPERAMQELVRVSSRWVLVSVPWSIQIEKTLCPHCGKDYYLYGHQHSFGIEGLSKLAEKSGARLERTEHVIPMFDCRRYKWFPPLKWLLWDHFKDTGTLGALLSKKKSG